MDNRESKSAIQYVYGPESDMQRKALFTQALSEGYEIVETVVDGTKHDAFPRALRWAKAAGAILLYVPNEVLDKAAANFKDVQIGSPRHVAA